MKLESYTTHRDLPLEVQDEVDGFKENTMFGIHVLDFLRLVRFLCLVDNGVKCFTQSGPHHWVSWRGGSDHTHVLVAGLLGLSKHCSSLMSLTLTQGAATK